MGLTNVIIFPTIDTRGVMFSSSIPWKFNLLSNVCCYCCHVYKMVSYRNKLKKYKISVKHTFHPVPFLQVKMNIKTAGIFSQCKVVLSL